MRGTRRQDIIDILLGRGHSAPEAFVRQRWPTWMRLRPRPSATRRDALLTLYRDRPLPGAPAPAPAPGTLAHWIGLVLWQMQPPPADQRGLRALALACSAGLHLLFALLLVWMALVRSLPPRSVAEERVAVVFESAGSGDGSNAAARDGEQATGQTARNDPGTGARPDAATIAAALSTAQPAASSAPASGQGELADVVPPPLPALPPVQMPMNLPQPTQLVVSEREVAMATDPVPVTPLPLPQQVAVARPVDRVLSVPEHSVELAADAPLVRVPAAIGVAAEIELAMPAMAVAERQVAVAAPAPSLRALPAQTAATVSLADAPLAVREREIVLQAPAPVVRGVRPAAPAVVIEPAGSAVPAVRERELTLASSPAGAPAAPMATAQQAGAAPATAAVTQGGSRSPAEAATAAAGRSATGAAAGGRAGADWSRSAASDDWSAAAGAGQGSGLVDGSGRGRLPDAPVAVRGAPGGEADQWTRQRLDSAGTWLKRPPYDHRPTSFDKYWVPNESLLAEWVRKGMKSVDIPIPGTSSRISCVISLLQLGGGCGLSDPNMQEQPAQARAAPDIPFKRELQQDNGSL